MMEKWFLLSLLCAAVKGTTLLDETEELIEGDILLNNKSFSEYQRIYKGVIEKSFKATNSDKRTKWPKTNGFVYVPYVISSSISYADKSRIEDVIKQYASKTCVRFVPRTNQEDFIHIVSNGGCSSYVGRIGGAQKLTLGRGCFRRKGTIIHELMHALGFWHEQARGDRDRYVSVHYENLRRGANRNFDKQVNWEAHGTKYDIGSVMHYGGYFFSRNGKPTIVDRATGKPIKENRLDFSETDIVEINRHYDCKDYPDTESSKNIEGARSLFGPKFEKITTTTTIKPTTKACKDINSNCDYWKKNNLCHGQYRSYMERGCALSCGYCTANGAQPTAASKTAFTTKATKPIPPSTTTPPPTKTTTTAKTSSFSCRDTSTSCSALAKNNYCNHSHQIYRNYMRRTCQRSCGFCSTFTESSKVVTSNKYANCKDKNRKCAEWASKNFCRQPNVLTFMQTTCPQSCRFC